MSKLFIVEDDDVIAGKIESFFQSYGYDTAIARDFSRVEEDCLRFDPDVVFMDILLPEYDGYYWCRQIRGSSSVPIIFISSKNHSMDIVLAMEMGGDDFIQKPFELPVLRAKTEALLRRIHGQDYGRDYLDHKGLRLYLGEMKVEFQGQTVELTKNECKILETLMTAKGKAVSRDRLMEKLWNSHVFIDDNTLTVNVGRLRKTLESIGAGEYIHTKRRVGYYV